jgi:hypothetical protein
VENQPRGAIGRGVRNAMSPSGSWRSRQGPARMSVSEAHAHMPSPWTFRTYGYTPETRTGRQIPLCNAARFARPWSNSLKAARFPPVGHPLLPFGPRNEILLTRRG